MQPTIAVAGSIAVQQPPAWALRLGYAALLPFVSGALHWGVAMREAAAPPSLFSSGVLPSFAAWVALKMPPSAGLVIHDAILIMCYDVDRLVYPRHGMAHWLTLRLRLSMVAALSCFLGAAGT